MGNGTNISDDNFYVQVFYKGALNTLEIIPHEGYFAIAYNGTIIGEIQYKEDWQQTSGEPLGEEIFETIKTTIEDKYE